MSTQDINDLYLAIENDILWNESFFKRLDDFIKKNEKLIKVIDLMKEVNCCESDDGDVSDMESVARRIVLLFSEGGQC